MKTWNELTSFQKIIAGICILAIAIALPEVMYLVDIGGLDLMFVLLASTLKPAIAWVRDKLKHIKHAINVAIIAFQHSASARPPVFTTQAVFCVVALCFTGSYFFALSFFIPSMLLNGVLI